MSSEEIYPLTVVADRYNGVYSGGKYTAWNMYPYVVPKDIFGDDIDCYDFWSEAKSNGLIFGVGDSVIEAIEKLNFKLQES